ncbi:MAG: hypothetical protein VB934_02820 [Polyangiaceae bacterium]
MKKILIYTMIPLLGILSAKVKVENKLTARALGVEQTSPVVNTSRYETSVYFRDLKAM